MDNEQVVNISYFKESKLNPLADVFLPSFVKEGDVIETNSTSFRDKCDRFCKKYKSLIYDDVNASIEQKNDFYELRYNHCMTEYDSYILEIYNVVKSKLCAAELLNIIHTHDKVFNSGVPNFKGCRIPV